MSAKYRISKLGEGEEGRREEKEMEAFFDGILVLHHARPPIPKEGSERPRVAFLPPLEIPSRLVRRPHHREKDGRNHKRISLPHVVALTDMEESPSQYDYLRPGHSQRSYLLHSTLSLQSHYAPF